MGNENLHNVNISFSTLFLLSRVIIAKKKNNSNIFAHYSQWLMFAEICPKASIKKLKKTLWYIPHLKKLYILLQIHDFLHRVNFSPTGFLSFTLISV